VNSIYDDYLPNISKDQLSLYFSSTRPGFGGDDIWVSLRDSTADAWGAPINIGSVINTSFNERTPSFSRDGHFLFFVTNQPPGFGLFDIWASRRENVHDDFHWEPPFNLGAAVNSAFNDVGPGFLEDGEDGKVSLYFSSSRPGGSGDFDIYVSQLRDDGSFGPAALVEELNSPLTELRPALRHDGLEIFFTKSSGTANSRDLWTSTRSAVDADWTLPRTLGAVVNSGVDDSFPAVAPDGLSLFFNSNRSDLQASGGLDLYVATRVKTKPSK
jgi:Tol biopolymer transport system component